MRPLRRGVRVVLLALRVQLATELVAAEGESVLLGLLRKTNLVSKNGSDHETELDKPLS